MELGVLDIGPIDEMIQLAPAAERLGYTRYWIAEHQPQPSPILLAMIVAGQTDQIRVGTAGVLLHYYPPLRTAHEFHLLERAHTGRIDAGFCAGLTLPGALVEGDLDGRDLDAVIAAYPERARRFVRQLRNTCANPAFDPSLAWPEVGGEPPQIWSLGTGTRSAELSGELGLGFGYGLMFRKSSDDPEAVKRYRACFVPHRDRPDPAVVVSVAGVCAESDAAAHAIAETWQNPHFLPRVVGDPAACASALAALAQRYAADEIVFLHLCSTLADRLRSIELLAGACGLEPRAAPAA